MTKVENKINKFRPIDIGLALIDDNETDNIQSSTNVKLDIQSSQSKCT